MEWQKLTQELGVRGVLKNSASKEAFEKVDRKDFVPEEYKDRAYEDTALPIGEGQTISQPYTVIFMLELLSLERGERVMDVGHGSGWQTALMAQIVGKKGGVYALERVPFLCEMGKNNVSKYPELFSRVQFYCQDASLGLTEISEQIDGFNGIIAAAEVKEVPLAWRKQLKIGGRLVYPKFSSIFKEIKISDDKFKAEEHPGFAFVPFIPN